MSYFPVKIGEFIEAWRFLQGLLLGLTLGATLPLCIYLITLFLQGDTS